MTEIIVPKPTFDPIEIQKKILIAGILNHPCVLDELHKGLSDVFADVLSEDIYKHACFVRPNASKEDALNGCAEIIDHLRNLKRMAEYGQNMDERFQEHLSSSKGDDEKAMDLNNYFEYKH